MINEFKIEAYEMFELAEEGLLNIEKGLDFSKNYNSIFRYFHSLKGAAGMFELNDLQMHMHKLESLFESLKTIGAINKDQIDYFLCGIDDAKNILSGNKSNFIHIEPNRFLTETLTLNKKQTTTPKTKIKSTSKGVVFIVDDEPDIVQILEDAISDNDFTIHKFYNGEEALEKFEELCPDLIISDINMPKLNGIEMIKAIRKISTTTPVIFVSGYLSKELMQEALAYGAEAFIEKPFSSLIVSNLCKNTVKKNQAMQLLEKSISYILYQFSDLDKYLESQGKDSLRQSLKLELEIILEQRNILKHSV
jgi:CheY-like chemotaxis protein/HPt (histidine-containing phosphotransfer) domain-containing protein